MVKKLYLDGCSLTYGTGLPRNQSLGALFEKVGEYEVTDFSRAGKSNLAIALDTYQHLNEHDIFVLGWTFSSRFTIKYQDQNLDFYVGSHGRGYELEPQDLDVAHQEVYKYFYTVFGHPFCDDLSDAMVDTTLSHLRLQNKQFLAFSWEKRQARNPIHYPYISGKDRLADGHLNQDGMLHLYHYLQNLLQ